MKKRICLITPGHIASNPRLIKEATALCAAGMQIHIVFSQYAGYLIDYDKRILKLNPDWTYDVLDWTGRSFRSKLARYFSGMLQRLAPAPELKINRNLRWQLRKAVLAKADLYIGHNLGALPVAILAAQRNRTRSGFDAEDFHRYQLADDLKNHNVELATSIEKKYIPLVDYLTAAGDLIAQKYQELFNISVLSIDNVFPKQNIQIALHEIKVPLKMFWFSQTIGPGRGLEEAIIAIGLSGAKTELHLLGEVTIDYKNYLYDKVRNHANNCSLYFYPTMFPDELFHFAKQFDIGLAIETGRPINRDICLTNKIFTYIQSGLCILASNTTAQCMFMKQYPHIGKIFNRKDPKSLADVLVFYHQNREKLLETRHAALRLAHDELNWEKESEKFLNQVFHTLSQN